MIRVSSMGKNNDVTDKENTVYRSRFEYILNEVFHISSLKCPWTIGKENGTYRSKNIN